MFIRDGERNNDVIVSFLYKNTSIFKKKISLIVLLRVTSILFKAMEVVNSDIEYIETSKGKPLLISGGYKYQNI